MVTLRNNSGRTIREIWGDVLCYDEFGAPTRDNHPGRCMYTDDPNHGQTPIRPGESKTIDVVTLYDGVPTQQRTKQAQVIITEAYEYPKPIPD